MTDEDSSQRFARLREAFDDLARQYVFAERVSALFHRTILGEALVPGNALDVGCGTGGLSRTLAHAGFRVVGIDFSHEMISAARSLTRDSENPVYRCASLEEYLAEPQSQTFNLVVAVKILHHLSLDEISRALAMISERLLGDDGRLIIVDLFTGCGDGVCSRALRRAKGSLAAAFAIGVPGIMKLPVAWFRDRRFRRSEAWRKHLDSEIIPTWGQWREIAASLDGYRMKQISPHQFMLVWTKSLKHE